MMVQIVKAAHILCAISSISFFIIRGIWMMQSSQRLAQSWVKITSRSIDTALLMSALGLMFITEQFPGSMGWLTAKLVALLVYIGLGMIALHWGKTKQIRISAWIASLVVFSYIVSVALTRSPLSFQAFL
ncbi:MAG: SirB2 family protein [Gammaproteobacteria bacterium]|nr:SirB2 family protein [Gammaproteobacteria bacterium]